VESRGRLALTALLLAVSGCASTKVESTWSNPSFPARKIKSFAVFASTGYPTGRIEFEQQLTDALRRHGLDAVPGYQFVAYDEYPGKEEILRRVQAKGIQGALISKTIQSFTQEDINPVVVGGAVSSGWDAAGFYEYWSAPLTFAEYTTEENKFVAETVLWALPDDKAMWAMRTATRRTDPGAFAEDIAATVAADLRRAGILPE
jgi:hypothetical protein